MLRIAVPYKVALGVSVSLTLADMAFATEGPVRGVIETIYNQRCGSMFVETVDL